MEKSDQSDHFPKKMKITKVWKNMEGDSMADNTSYMREGAHPKINIFGHK